MSGIARVSIHYASFAHLVLDAQQALALQPIYHQHLGVNGWSRLSPIKAFSSPFLGLGVG
jgi:hypothetical protein